MRPRNRYWSALTVILVLLSPGLATLVTAQGTTCPPAAYLIVSGQTRPFCEVRDAVAAAVPGATVAIVPALAPYREALVIATSASGLPLDGLLLCPASGDGAGCTDAPFTRPTLDATGFDAPALRITADHVTVKGLALQGATPVVESRGTSSLTLERILVTTQTSTTRATDGIHLIGTTDATVRQSEVRGNLYAGSAAIRAIDTQGTRIDANTFTQSGSAVLLQRGSSAHLERNAITVSGVGSDVGSSIGLRFIGGTGHNTDGNRIDGVGVGILNAGSTHLTLRRDTVRSVPVGIQLTTAATVQPTGTVLRDVGLAGADTPLRLDASVHDIHVDASCNDWGAYSTKTIADTRIRDDGHNNTIAYTPYKAPTTDGLLCLKLPTAAFTHDPLIADRLTDVHFTSTSTDGSYPVVAHDWDLGDGTRTNTQHPTHRYTDVGVFEVKLTVTDTDGMTHAIARPFVVRDHAPTVAPLSDQSVDEGTLLEVPIEVHDIEADPITWQVMPQNGDARVTTDAAGTRFLWTPDHFQAGAHTFLLTADDGYETTTTTLNITVGDVEGAPVITPIDPVHGREGIPIVVEVSAVDPEGVIPALALFVLPPGALFVDHGDGTGTFTWTPGYFQSGTYTLTLQASDGFRIDQEALVVHVADTNRAPSLVPVGDRTFAVGETGGFVVSATDPDGDTLAITLAPLPTGATWDAPTRRFSWTPTAAQAGEGWLVTATADDGKLGTATTTFWLNVAGDVRHAVKAKTESPAALRAIPGSVVHHTFTVHNLGTTTRTFALDLERVPLGWDVRLPAPTVTLQPDERRTLALDIVPDGRHIIGRVELSIDDGIVADALVFNTLVPLDIKIEVHETFPVEGAVFVRYLDGRPLANRPVELIESTKSGGLRTLRGETDADGVFAFSFGIDPLGSGMPGEHQLKVRVPRMGGNSWGFGEYRIG